MHFALLRYNPVMGTMIDLSKPSLKTSTEEEDFLRSQYDTEVIHLQNYDNFYSLMDRLVQRDAAGESSRRLLLIWPPRGEILSSPLEFSRLQSWALRNGYEIALVIPGRSVKFEIAKEQGLPVFRNLREAGAGSWTSPDKALQIPDEADRGRKLALLKKDVEQNERPKVSFGVRLLFFLLALGVTAGVCYAVLPQARVEITNYLTRQSVNMVIWTDERLSSPTLAGGIPMIEKKYDLTLSAVVPASGTIQTEKGIAIGNITVRNSCDRVYTTAAGVEVGTNEDFSSGINFITLESTYLAPGEERNVRIEAVKSGAEGNLPSGSIRYAAYPDSLCWEIRQEQPTKGGTTGIYHTPSEQDRQAALKMIDDQVQEAAADALENDPESADFLPLGDAVVSAVKYIEMSPEEGYASDELSVREALEVTWKVVRKSDMEAIVRGQTARMDQQIAEFTGYEILSGPKEENGLMTWSVRADYLVYDPQSNEEALQIMLRGKTLDQARSILDTLDHVQSYSIKILPSVMKRMPLTAQNIQVIIHPGVEVEEKN